MTIPTIDTEELELMIQHHIPAPKGLTATLIRNDGTAVTRPVIAFDQYRRPMVLGARGLRALYEEDKDWCLNHWEEPPSQFVAAPPGTVATVVIAVDGRPVEECWQVVGYTPTDVVALNYYTGELETVRALYTDSDGNTDAITQVTVGREAP